MSESEQPVDTGIVDGYRSDLQKHGQTHMEDMERTTGTGETKCFLSDERYTSR